jgi:hypothetical protein
LNDHELCAALAARLDECWDRLDDVVSELHAVHEVEQDLIVERIRAVIAWEHGAEKTPEDRLVF